MKTYEQYEKWKTVELWLQKIHWKRGDVHPPFLFVLSDSSRLPPCPPGTLHQKHFLQCVVLRERCIILSRSGEMPILGKQSPKINMFTSVHTRSVGSKTHCNLLPARSISTRNPAAAGQKLLFEKLSGVRKFTTFFLTKNDHRCVTFISLKTINSDLQQ